MNPKGIGFVFILFAFVVGVAAIAPSSFADHSTAEVSIPLDTSVPGCEETDECWLPSTVTIDVGGEITWSNDDTATHTVTSGTPTDGPDGFFDSGLLVAGNTFSVKFDDFEPAEYPYYSMVHPWMVGTVIVQEAEAEEEELMVSINTEPKMTINEQWEMFHDAEQITCDDGYGILIKNSNGNPVCVKPSGYLRLVDRGYGEPDFKLMSKNLHFMNGIDNNIMNHPELQDDVIDDPDMIQAMKKNSQWMNHMQGKGIMGQEMMMDKYTMGCKWCPTSEKPIEDPWRIHDMQHMEEVIDELIDEPQFRVQMMNHMMGNPQFMQQLTQNQKFMQQISL